MNVVQLACFHVGHNLGSWIPWVGIRYLDGPKHLLYWSKRDIVHRQCSSETSLSLYSSLHLFVHGSAYVLYLSSVVSCTHATVECFLRRLLIIKYSSCFATWQSYVA